jgi:hypothetical protein
MKKTAILSFVIFFLFAGIHDAYSSFFYEKNQAVFFQYVMPDNNGGSGIIFWGYFHVNCGDISSLKTLTDANIIKINKQNYRWKACLDEVKKYNLKAIIDVKSIFFNKTREGQYGDGSYTLRSDWKERWKNFKSEINGYEPFIYAFYMDEPYWKGIKEDDFVFVTSQIRKDFPEIGVFIIEAVPSFAEYRCRPPGPKVTSSYYKYVTDIAFDFYGVDYICGIKQDAFSDWSKEQYNNFFQSFLSITNKNQKVWVVPQTFWPIGYTPNFNRLSSQLEDYYNIAKDKKAVGLINFLFSPTENHIGAKQFFDPKSQYYNLNYKNKHISLARLIIKNTTSPPTTSTTTTTSPPTTSTTTTTHPPTTPSVTTTSTTTTTHPPTTPSVTTTPTTTTTIPSTTSTQQRTTTSLSIETTQLIPTQTIFIPTTTSSENKISTTTSVITTKTIYIKTTLEVKKTPREITSTIPSKGSKQEVINCYDRKLNILEKILCLFYKIKNIFQGINI